MATLEIATKNWHPFFEEFNKIHAATEATIEVISPELGAQELNRPMPLVGISFDDAGSEKGSIVVMLGTESERHLAHLIEHPTRVWLKVDGASTNDALEIEDADNSKTIVQLHPGPVLPN